VKHGLAICGDRLENFNVLFAMQKHHGIEFKAWEASEQLYKRHLGNQNSSSNQRKDLSRDHSKRGKSSKCFMPLIEKVEVAAGLSAN
jgi:hypothetical protein